MDKKELMARTHADYLKALTVMGDAIAAVAEARKTLNVLNIPTASTAYITMGNMVDELCNINSAVARDYVDDVEALRKQN